MQSRSASQSSTASPEATIAGAGRAAEESGSLTLNTLCLGTDVRRSNCVALISHFPVATVVGPVWSAERQKYVAGYLNPRIGHPWAAAIKLVIARAAGGAPSGPAAREAVGGAGCGGRPN